jgi:hypothetical protein
MLRAIARRHRHSAMRGRMGRLGEMWSVRVVGLGGHTRLYVTPLRVSHVLRRVLSRVLEP